MTRWNKDKNERLLRQRGVSFAELMAGEVLCARDNPGRPNQEILLVLFNGYVWAIPYVEDAGEMFLKTAYPSRKYTKKYLNGELL